VVAVGRHHRSVFGEALSSHVKAGIHSDAYINTRSIRQTIDVDSGHGQAAVFGFIVAFDGLYHGYHSRGGAQGGGAETTNAVVSGLDLILVFNYFLTEAFFSR